MAVKEGGVIIAANEQNDGVGSDEFEQIITTEADILAPTRTLLGTSVHFL
jgi:co-chaperonin GroES (HSP10)